MSEAVVAVDEATTQGLLMLLLLTYSIILTNLLRDYFVLIFVDPL